ncbi:MAG: hypothetical protein P8N63_13305, partial [Pseudomonadales bacterium]|nr:hypothetical protein [Pseudomonadales bacterium]
MNRLKPYLFQCFSFVFLQLIANSNSFGEPSLSPYENAAETTSLQQLKSVAPTIQTTEDSASET